MWFSSRSGPWTPPTHGFPTLLPSPLWVKRALRPKRRSDPQDWRSLGLWMTTWKPACQIGTALHPAVTETLESVVTAVNLSRDWNSSHATLTTNTENCDEFGGWGNELEVSFWVILLCGNIESDLTNLKGNKGVIDNTFSDFRHDLKGSLFRVYEFHSDWPNLGHVSHLKTNQKSQGMWRPGCLGLGGMFCPVLGEQSTLPWGRERVIPQWGIRVLKKRKWMLDVKNQ